MTRSDDLRKIREHLESALYHALGLPVSPHQLCLEAQLREAHARWVELYESAEKRAEKGRR